MWGNGMLIFPYYERENNEISKQSSGESVSVFGDKSPNDSLQYWQGRYFPTQSPKVINRGFPDKYVNFRTNLRNDGSGGDGRIIVVEDSLSAIKVNRVENSMELLGSNLSMHKALRLSRVFSHLTLWLDSDKLLTATKFVNKYSSLFDKCDYIYTEKDPKEYSTEEIRKILNE